MSKKFVALSLMAMAPSAAMAQTVGGGGSIALPEIQISQTTRFDPNARKYDGNIGLTSNITGIDKPILDTPRSVYVVTPKTLQEQMPQSLAEAVQTIPGTYTGNTGGGNSDFITIHGFEVNTTDSFLIGNGNGLLVDGIRAPFDRAFNANTQSVAILSGPASYEYGYAAEGGILNIERKLPLPEAHYAVDLLGGAVTGSFKDVAGSFDFTGPIFKSTEGVFAYRLVGSAARNEPWRIGDTVNRDFLMAPTFAWYSDLFTATIAYEHNKNQQPYDRGDTSFGGAPLNIPPTTSYAEPYSVYNEGVDWVHGKVDYNASKDTDFHFRYSYAATSLHFAEVRSDHQTDFNPATGDISRYFYTNGPNGAENVQGFFGLNGVHRFDTGFLHHELNIGGDYYNALQTEADEYFTPNTTNFNLYNPIHGFPPVGPVLDYAALTGVPNGQPLLKAKIRELGLFGQDAVSLGNLTLAGGGRYSEVYAYQTYYNNVTSNNTTHIFLPSASALYKINPDTALFADYAQSLHPNIFAAGLGTAITFEGPAVPETGQGYEAGIKHKFLDGNLLTQVSVFRIDKQHVVTQSETGAIAFTQAQRSEGASLSVVGRITPNFDLNVAYSHQNVIVTADDPSQMDTGLRVPNAPENIYTVFGSYHFLEGRLNHLTLNAGVTGATSNVADLQNAVVLPAYTIANLGFSYTFVRGPNLPVTTLSFKINNLFDSTYYPSSGTKTNWITVGEPRNFLLDLNMSL